MDTRRLLLFTAIAVCTCLFGAWPGAAHAQAPVRGFAVNRYEPAERGSDWYVNESLDFRGNFRPAVGTVLDWAYRPLVLYDPSNIQGNPRANVITDQIFANVGGSIVLHDRFRIGANLPVVLFQDGEDISAITRTTSTPDKPALGDARLSGDVRVLGQYGGTISAAIGAQVHFPTGRRSLFTSDGTVRVTPRLLVAGDFEGFLYAAKLGFAYRPLDATFEDRNLGSDLVFSAAFGVKVNDRFVFGAEVYGSTVVAGGDGALRTRNTPLEMLLSTHLTLAQHWKAGSAIGPGFTRADGTPTMRVLFSFEFTPDVCVDPDGDGICSGQDVCPSVDGVPENHGCPADRDHDGFNDPDDACPDAAGSRTADPKTTGCPDHDDDGVADRNDACVDVAGVPTDDPKTNGCPRAEAPAEKVVIPQQLAFAPGASALDPQAETTLRAVAKILAENPQLRIRIEGHADDREAKPADVKKLTTDRADAARKWLEGHGVDPVRLRAEAYGSDRLIDTTGTDEGRRKNRRVEFHVIEETTEPGKK
jgi:outer membrane protein OmpA-like peptidoglycan-associated protein